MANEDRNSVFNKSLWIHPVQDVKYPDLYTYHIMGDYDEHRAVYGTVDNDLESANLFAASPDLLKALSHMVEIWEGPRDRAAVAFAAAIVEARKAISKAEGK